MSFLWPWEVSLPDSASFHPSPTCFGAFLHWNLLVLYACNSSAFLLHICLADLFHLDWFQDPWNLGGWEKLKFSKLEAMLDPVLYPAIYSPTPTYNHKAIFLQHLPSMLNVSQVLICAAVSPGYGTEIHTDWKLSLGSGLLRERPIIKAWGEKGTTSV